MDVPPRIRRSHRVALDGTVVRVEGPRLVRMPRIHRAQRRPFDLPEKRGLVVMVHVRIVSRLRRRARKVQVAPVGSGSRH